MILPKPLLDFESTTEIVREARRVLEPQVWDYIAGGAETETTILRNRAAIEAYAFRARVLRDVSVIDATSTLLGSQLRIPYIAAPLGGLEQIHADGAAAVVRGAREFGALPVVSSVSLPSLEMCAAAGEGPKWFQLYIRGDFAWITAMVERAQAAGFTTLVLTVDSAHYDNRERQVLQRWTPMGRSDSTGTGFQALLDWDTIDRIRKIGPMHLVVKGIQTGEDAALAREHGVDAIWVSNHGGRQLDHSRGTLDVLPEVLHAAGSLPVIVDGGFLRGTDVVKALALGAAAVAGGRFVAFALAAGGAAAISRAFELMEFELKKTMALIGVTSIQQLDASYVSTCAPISPSPGPFPLL